MKRPLLVLAVCLLSAGTLCAQQASPPRMTFRMGVGYDRGDYGSRQITTAKYVPFSLRYTGSLVELGVSSGIVHLDSPDGIRLIDGVPTPAGPRGRPLLETGIADTTIRSRFFVVTDDGPGTSTPSVTPFLRVKLPTADEERGLGTGKTDYGIGVELDKEVGSAVYLLGDFEYTVVGKVPALGLRNRPSASFGIGKQLSEKFTATGMLDWRRAIVAGNPNPAELVGLMNWRATTNVSVSPNAFVGLTDGSPDFGAGLQFGFRF